jgi:hypothetical protein
LDKAETIHEEENRITKKLKEWNQVNVFWFDPDDGSSMAL